MARVVDGRQVPCGIEVKSSVKLWSDVQFDGDGFAHHDGANNDALYAKECGGDTRAEVNVDGLSCDELQVLESQQDDGVVACKPIQPPHHRPG